jgi:hypothetical protein
MRHGPLAAAITGTVIPPSVIQSSLGFNRNLKLKFNGVTLSPLHWHGPAMNFN